MASEVPGATEAGASGAPADDIQVPPCCQAWRKKYLNAEKGRRFLKQAMPLYDRKIDELEVENANLKKAIEELQVQANMEKDGRENELAAKTSLEMEITAMKSKLSCLKQKEVTGGQDKNEEIKVLQDLVSDREKEINCLKELLETEKKRVDSEKKNAEVEKKKAAETLKCLKAEKGKTDEEKRVANLERKKAEDYKLQLEALNKKNHETNSKLVSEMSKLKEASKELEAERLKAIDERKRADLEMSKAQKQRKLAEANVKKADEERRVANLEREKAEGYRLQLEALNREIHEANAKLVSETSKLKEASKNLEAGRLKAVEERKRADLEMSKAQEQRKLAEANMKRAVEETLHANSLSEQLEDAERKIEELKEIHKLALSKKSGEVTFDQQGTNIDDKSSKNENAPHLVSELLQSGSEKGFKIETGKAISEKKQEVAEMKKEEKQKKLADASKKMAMEENSRADCLSKQLEEAGVKIKELQKQIDAFSYSRLKDHALTDANEKDTNAETAKRKHLKKQLKFQKQKVKHAKEVAELERVRSSILQQELCGLKLNLVQFYQRLDLMDKCFSIPTGGKEDAEKPEDITNFQGLELKGKLCSLRSCQTNLQDENRLLTGNCMGVTASNPLWGTFQHSAPLLPLYGGSYNKSISGTDSQLESLLGGSNQKMLQSSAINSSTASFSDRQLVGSQENGSLSVGTPARQGEENLNGDLSAEVAKKRDNKNLAVVAENSVRSPLSTDAGAKVVVHNRKRKRIPDAIESIELSCSEIKKFYMRVEDDLSVLRGMLRGRTDESSDKVKLLRPNSQSYSQAKHDFSHKKRGKSHDEKVVMPHDDCGQPKQKGKLDTVVQEDANVFQRPSKLVDYPTETEEVHQDVLCCSIPTDASFEDVVNEDYMKLLNLDNAGDEKCYRMAMEVPISPTLPEIKFLGPELFESDNFKPLVDESIQQGFCHGKKSFTSSCNFDVIDVEIDSNRLRYNKSQTVDQLVQLDNEASVDILVSSRSNLCDTMPAGGAGVQSSQMEVETEPSPGNERMMISSESKFESAGESMPGYCFVFSNVKESNSISRIICATRSCEAWCSLATQTDFMVHKIALALKMEEKLSAREKACVFFSLVLLNYTMATSQKCSTSRDFIPCLKSFAGHINAVMSDAEGRTFFSELCLDELLGLIQDFLLDGRLMLYTAVPSGTVAESDLIINDVAGGVNSMWSSVAASADQVVAGSIIFASICAATGHAEFICEAAYNILRKHMYDTSVVLTILHVFAFLDEDKIFSSRKYNLTAIVLKSLVLFLERGSSSDDEVSCPSKFYQCADCPFSEDVASVEVVMSVLLKELNAYSGIMLHQDLLANSSKSTILIHKHRIGQSSGCNEVSCVLDMNYDASCYLDKSRIFDKQLENSSERTLCHITDVLSLVELLASNMSWSWTCSEIITPLLRMLDSPLPDGLIVSILILLGQLGRLGVDAVGYEDKGMENLRSQLSVFLWRDTTIRAGLPIQIATISAMLGLLPFSVVEVVKDNTKPPEITSHSDPVDLIGSWLHSLSEEQRALTISLLQSTSVISK
ncbi:hypothetical protein SLE2022_338780 [Rubroshorea leprosula]